ncbi:MAG: hypothetical protein C7B46_00360 [Sulfobacillus benefaciens]|uniref:Uncharacterized protein n=1 Tax=Sulfobacillus benefaciens TaxID=453960 RepID=A0A2T2XM17_9FIRM|nr:MAG: hypothetical protein C7B46_00360 [Sulfobacillus benefaciens]
MIPKQNRQWAAAMLGAVVAGSAIQAVTSHQRIQLIRQAQHYKIQSQEWQQKARRLEQELSAINRQAEQGTYIQSVRIEIATLPPHLSKVAVDAALEPYTETLLGAALAQIRIMMVYNMFNNRIVALGGALYRVEVKALLLSPATTVYVTVTPQAIPRTT